ncbi:MAG: cold shock domain-containing protein [Bacteroidetes bacterium]|nr:cold shock domain-containing protein [Bacteroidota bacterium]MBS1974568.1 cold shock domain-containing protein [Bacteroidota bacterium]
MAETWNKKEREKKKQQIKKQKEERRQERKEKAKESKSFDSMLAYMDENGNLSDTPPDPRKSEKIKLENIQIGTPKLEDREKETNLHKGIVMSFNEGKGFGFIKDRATQQNIFFHISGLEEPVKAQNKVSFEIEKGPKGLTAINVRLLR